MKSTRLSTALAALAARRGEALTIIAEARQTIAEQERRIADLDSLIATLEAPPAAPAAPRQKRGAVEAAIMAALARPPHRAYTAEALHIATTHNPKSLHSALRRLAADKTIVVEDGRYRLPLPIEQDATEMAADD
jgi:hypothetical protein